MIPSSKVSLRYLLGIGFALLFGMANASASGYSLGLQGGLVRHDLALSGANFSGYSTSPGTGVAVGMHGGRRGNRLGIEIGAAVQDRKYDITGGGSTRSISYSALETELLVRLFIRSLSFGAGAYLSSGLGSAEVTQSGTKQTMSLTALGLNVLDSGFVGSLRYTLPSRGKLSLTADARYLYGTTDLANQPSAQAGTREIQLLVGAELAL